MSDFMVLKEYYIRYLRDVRGSKESTINHYLGALTTISKYLAERGKINESIYEINELDELEIVKSYLFSCPDFVEKDERGRRMYSAGLNNYIRFASGEQFDEVASAKFTELDILVPAGQQHTSNVKQWKRSGIIKKQSIEIAHYTCEANQNHQSFVSASTGHQYMEGHHAIPMMQQEHFNVSLDVYANVVCLCPICHRLLHYGIKEDKMNVLNMIYSDRAERLAKSGIILSREEFIDVVNA